VVTAQHLFPNSSHFHGQTPATAPKWTHTKNIQLEEERAVDVLEFET